MGQFSDVLPVEEIYLSSTKYNWNDIIIFKSGTLDSDIDFKFEYDKDISISKYKQILLNHIKFHAKYFCIRKNVIIFKDDNLNSIAYFNIPGDKILTIRKYKNKTLLFSPIGLKSYKYIIDINTDKIQNNVNSKPR